MTVFNDSDDNPLAMGVRSLGFLSVSQSLELLLLTDKALRKHAHAIFTIAAIFHGCKNEIFQMKKKNDIFLIFAQNIDCGYK